MQKYDITYYTEIDLTVSTIDLALEKKCPLGWKYEEKNGRPYDGLVYVLDGSATYTMQDKSFTVKKNDIFFLHKGSRYTTDGDTSVPFQFIVVSFGLIESNLLQSLPFDEVISAANPFAYFNLFHELENLWFYRGIAYKIKCKTILQDILFNILHDSVQHRINTTELARIQPSVSYMDNNYDRDIDIDNLAKLTGLSTTHFRRLFKKVYRISPLEYLISIRVSKAKDLIKSDMYNVSEIAELTGFSDICYFSRMFKKYTGCCPTKFRDIT